MECFPLSRREILERSFNLILFFLIKNYIYIVRFLYHTPPPNQWFTAVVTYISSHSRCASADVWLRAALLAPLSVFLVLRPTGQARCGACPLPRLKERAGELTMPLRASAQSWHRPCPSSRWPQGMAWPRPACPERRGAPLPQPAAGHIPRYRGGRGEREGQGTPDGALKRASQTRKVFNSASWPDGFSLI